MTRPASRLQPTEAIQKHPNLRRPRDHRRWIDVPVEIRDDEGNDFTVILEVPVEVIRDGLHGIPDYQIDGTPMVVSISPKPDGYHALVLGLLACEPTPDPNRPGRRCPLWEARLTETIDKYPELLEAK